MEQTNENKLALLKSPWLMAGLVAVGVFVLCFAAINYVSRPHEDKGPDVKLEVIATEQTNPELIAIARAQGWIEPQATQLTTVDAAKVTTIDSVFQGSDIKRFDEFRHFIGVDHIAADAFAHAESLVSTVIPPSVADIRYGAFAHCPSLQALSVDTANTHYDSRGGCNAIVCTWKGKLMLVAGCMNTTVPDGVRFIAPRAFQGCTGLEAVALPDRLTEVGEEAFMHCTSLRSMEIPQGVRFIEPRTFMGCTQLATVSLPKSIEWLRRDAFAQCAGLSSIVCPKRYPPHMDRAFDAFSATVSVPRGMKGKYADDPGWKNFKIADNL